MVLNCKEPMGSYQLECLYNELGVKLGAALQDEAVAQLGEARGLDD